MVDERLARLLLVAAAMAVTWDSLICVYLALSPLILTRANTARDLASASKLDLCFSLLLYVVHPLAIESSLNAP